MTIITKSRGNEFYLFDFCRLKVIKMFYNLLRRASEKHPLSAPAALSCQLKQKAANCLRPEAGPLGQHHQPTQGKIFGLIVPAQYFAPQFALTLQTH